MPFNLKESKVLLIETVTELLNIPDFLLIVEERDSVIKDEVLYWNRHFGQGYVVVNTNTKEVHLVTNVEEALSSENMADPANIELTYIDINDCVYIYSQGRAKEIIDEIDDYEVKKAIFALHARNLDFNLVH